MMLDACRAGGFVEDTVPVCVSPIVIEPQVSQGLVSLTLNKSGDSLSSSSSAGKRRSCPPVNIPNARSGLGTFQTALASPSPPPQASYSSGSESPEPGQPAADTSAQRQSGGRA